MKHDLFVQEGITIPAHELDITASRSSGPGGQHVNKVSTRITVRWNIHQSHVLTDEQKERVISTIKHEITEHGDILISQGSSRSQLRNKEMALKELAALICAALKVPKKRIASTIPKNILNKRLHTKKERSSIKRLRSKKIDE